MLRTKKKGDVQKRASLERGISQKGKERGGGGGRVTINLKTSTGTRCGLDAEGGFKRRDLAKLKSRGKGQDTKFVINETGGG